MNIDIENLIYELYECDDKYIFCENINESKKLNNLNKNVCKDKRRDFFSCGICGSKDLIRQGVVYCSSCNKEIDFIDEYMKICYNDYYNNLCECNRSYKHVIYNNKCVVCGSIESYICPNCKRKSWKSSKGDIIFCKHCGYNINKIG